MSDPKRDDLAVALAEYGFDETDTANAVDAVLPILRAFGAEEYGRGVEYGASQARSSIARRLGLERR